MNQSNVDFARKECDMFKQSPRLLTYDEIKQLKSCKWIWVEIQEINCYPNVLYHLQLVKDANEVKDDEYENYIILDLGGPEYDVSYRTNDYGWRIWTCKPSKIAMKKQKWPTYTCNDCEYCDKENNRCGNIKVPSDRRELKYIDFDLDLSYGSCEYYRYNPQIVY